MSEQQISNAPNTEHRGVSRSMADTVRIGVWSAAVVAIGYLPHIPNVEGVSLTIALAGAVLGWKAGLMVGVIGEGLYSLFNPWGPPGPFLLVSQIIGMATVGATAGFVQKIFPGNKFTHKLGWAVTGFLVTLWFDSVTTLSFPLASGMDSKAIAVILAQQFIFSLLHLLSNALLFGIVLVPLRDRLRRFLETSLFRSAT